jgi:light-regulated signal transduction histidine kinase (bacteriophytochrome)
MLGRRLVEIMPERYRARHIQWFELANRSGKLRAPGREYQMEAIRRDGSEFAVELSVDRVDVAGEPLYVAILRDVTERHRVLAELERSNEELEQFAYVASHDLQEPLRMVVQYLNRLKDKYGDQFDTQGLKYLNYAVDGGMRMRRLIEDLLVYARVTTKARPVEPVDTGDLVNMVIDDVAALAGVEHGRVQVVTDMPVVDADPSQLRQVFMNLIANALKFHAPGASPEVKVSAAAEDGFWRFSIADNGIGIDPVAGRRLFMLFTRLHARDEYAGTGIGLAICKKIVLRHEGRIWFESTPGQGTTFHFTLPREVKDRP